MDPRLDRAFSSRRAVYGDQLNDGVIDHGKAVLLFLPDENSLGSVCVRRAFDRSSFFAFVKRDTRNSLQLVRHPAFFLLFFFRTWKIIIISPSRCVKRINKRITPPDRDKSNRARSGRTTISNDFTRNYSFPSFFLFFLSPLLDIGKLHRLDCESCDYVRIFVVRLYDTEQEKWSSHEVVAGRLDSRGRGLFEGAPWLTYDGSVAYGIYGTARCFHPSIHPKDEETIVDDSGREKGTFNAGQTSVTRVGGRARMGTFMVNFDGLCNPL